MAIFIEFIDNYKWNEFDEITIGRGILLCVNDQNVIMLQMSASINDRARARLRRRRTLERIRFQSTKEKPSTTDHDMTSIERQVTMIIDAMLPFVRERVDVEMTDAHLLVDMRTILIDHVHRICFPNGNQSDLFEHQLTSIVDDTFAKYSTLRYGDDTFVNWWNFMLILFRDF